MNNYPQIEKLKQSPMFNASLASKELFHSNFIAWFFETYKVETVNFFQSQFNISGLIQLENVYREERNLDLTLEFNDSIKVIIENKVKSLPDNGQLNAYKEKVKNEKSTLVLLSLFEHDYTPFLSYPVLLEWMKSVIESKDRNDSNSKRNYYITTDYIDFVKELTSLVQVIQQDNDVFNFDSRSTIYNQFKEVRLHDIFHKIKYKLILDKVSEKIADWLNNELHIPQEKHHHLFAPGSYFSRGTAAACFHIPINGDEKGRKYFEIQLQDNMLKFMVFAGKIYPNRTVVEKVSLFHQFFNLIDGSSELFDTTKMRKDYCKYGDYIIYKYQNVKSGIALDSLIFHIVECIKQVIINTHERQDQIDMFLNAPLPNENMNIVWK